MKNIFCYSPDPGPVISAGVHVAKKVAAMLLLVLVGGLHAAVVNPGTGYTSGFDVQPPAADWATMSKAGSGSDSYDTDSDVNTSITASGFTTQTLLDNGNPPTQNGSATWSSTGMYLQTRPTGNRYTALLGKFVNNTGTNATQIVISYVFTIGSGTSAEDSGKGNRVYYSLSGQANSWTNLVTFNTTSSAAGSSTVSTNLAVNWPNGGNLYLLWVDDNTATGTDVANQIDNFSLQVTAGLPLTLSCALEAPTNNAVLASGGPIMAAAVVANGTAPFSVQYYLSSGDGNTAFTLAGASSVAPFHVSLGNLAAGIYNIYARVSDDEGATSNSATNTFTVIEPLALTLTAPANEATFNNSTPVSATVTVAGGTAPYAVQFYLDNVPSGAPLTAAPYTYSFGPLFVGDHTIRATVADARNWVSNSLVHTVHVTGPLGVALSPTNGTAYNYGQPVAFTAAVGGGTGPYSVAFYTNDQLIGTLSAAPFAIDLGLLPVGSYSTYVLVTDSASPAHGQVTSSTNLIAVLPNPLAVTLTSPTSGQNVTAGSALTLSATATVGLPVAVTNVQFFVDGASAGSDNTAPYSASATLATGTHLVYAVAMDSLGRTSFSATNQVAASVPAGANDNFNNAIVLTGPIVTSTGNNSTATKQFPGEPNIAGNFGGASLWWTWTATASGPTTIDTLGSDFNTLLGVYTGTAVNALTLVAANNDYNGNTWSRVDFEAVAGTVYRIAVDGFASGGFPPQPARGNVVLNIKGVGGLNFLTPTNGMVFTLGDLIPVEVSIDSTFPNPPATRVDFYRGGVLFASSTSAPYTAVATNVPAGTNSFYVIAYDNAGSPVQSPVVNVFVQTVGVTLLTPAEDTVFMNTNPISVSAWAYLPAGTITNVEFFVDGVTFGEDATVPFNATWSNVTGGSHRLTAVGRSDTGASYVSQPVNIGVASTLMPYASVWKYLDDGSDQGTNWISPNFDDSEWATGPAPLGYSDSNGRLPATTNSFGPDSANKYPTTYYRQAIVINNVASYSGFTLNLERDDGAIVYLNGAEVGRFNMPTGAVSYTAYALANANDDGGTIYAAPVSPARFVEGTNVLAVEIHQDSANSSDIWFQMQLIGNPIIIHNLQPVVTVISPTNTQYFVAPSSIPLEATASDADGTVTKVEFYADDLKLGEATSSPYRFTWNNPPVGAHMIYAVATDDQGASGIGEAAIVVYNAAGTPVAQVTSPVDGYTVEGPTNVVLAASANAISGVTQVQFLANGAVIGSAAASPYTFQWNNVPFGTHSLAAVACDNLGICGTSAPISLTITIPPTNLIPPTVAAKFPAASATISNLTTIQVTFSERVLGVDARDLLVNEVPATAVTGSGSNYTFTVVQPPYGEVNIRWSDQHGITDIGWPANLAFYENSGGARWSYHLVDLTPPAVAAKVPAAGSTVTNLTELAVTFTEPVTGVDAGDLLVNGVPAYDVVGSGSTYTFNVSQPASGTVNITWVPQHGITDTAPAANAFNATGPGATWNLTLDAKTVLIQSNSFWRFVKGTNEASTPINAWRQLGYDDSGWSNAPAPFFYGDPYSNGVPAYTHLTDMRSNYTAIYLRQAFVVPNAANVTNLFLRAQIDDGMIVWINGVEVLRTNVAAGDIAYNGTASGAATEQNGVPYANYSLLNPRSYLLSGTNVIAVHALNESLATSSDFGFNAQLYTYQTDTEAVAPRVVLHDPPAGYVLGLTNITVTFSEPVTGVEAADLLINGVAASSLSSSSNTMFTFSFPQPAFGAVAITWAASHGIVDQDIQPKPFNSTLPSSTWGYNLLNANAPYLLSVVPAETTVNELSHITLVFSELVTGVEAADLLINGVPATSLSSVGATYTFTFPQPVYGTVSIDWVTNHGILDLEVPANPFDLSWPGHRWSYNLVDKTAPVLVTQSPVAGSSVVNLTEITVTFSEAVVGVTAGDLLINGKTARSVTGTNTTYTFSFPQPNASLVNVTWSPNHGIRDRATVPNAFDATVPGANWSYTTVDNVAPTVSLVNPPPFVAVRSLSQIEVTFDEPVNGVNASDLLINGAPSAQVSGTGAGPYMFAFTPPPTGQVQVAWAAAHGIQDLAATPVSFAGGTWTYTLNPSLATEFAVGHVIHISVDGLGSFYMGDYITNSPTLFPNFRRLVTEGASTLNARVDYTASETVPNHSSQLTGRPVEQPEGWANTTHHGVTFNSDNGQTIHISGNPLVPYKSSPFDVVHDHGLSTAFLYSKGSLTFMARSWSTGGGPDLIGADNGSNKIDFLHSSVNSGNYGPSSALVDDVVNAIQTNGLWNYTFMHWTEPDQYGHQAGWGSTSFSNQVLILDAQLGRILDALQANPSMANQTVILLTADHGGTGAGHFEENVPATYTLPFCMWGAGIPKGVDAYTLFSNRADPGNTRPSFSDTSVMQPLHNADVANLAVTLLGLPVIPGSSIIPVLGDKPVPLTVMKSEFGVIIAWPAAVAGYELQVSSALGANAVWQPVTQGITTSGQMKIFHFTTAPETPVGFFRLQKR